MSATAAEFWTEEEINLSNIADFLHANGLEVERGGRSHLTLKLRRGNVAIVVQPEERSLRLFCLLPLESANLPALNSHFSPFVLRPHREALACDLEISTAGGLLTRHLLWAAERFADLLPPLHNATHGLLQLPPRATKAPQNLHHARPQNALTADDFAPKALLKRLRAAGFACQEVEGGHIFLSKAEDGALLSFWNEEESVQLQASFPFAQGEANERRARAAVAR